MKKISLLSVATLALIGTALVAQAYEPLVPLPGTLVEGTTQTNLNQYLAGGFKLLIALSGVIAVMVAIAGGVQYVAAGINPSAKSNAKERIEHAFVGIALVLSSYLILNTINPKLVEFNLILPPINTAVSPATGSAGAGVPLVAEGQVASGVTAPLQTGAVNTTVPSPSVATLFPAASVGQPTGSLFSSYTGTTVDHLAVGGLRESINTTNDYAIMKYCLVNPSHNLCSRGDLNGDQKTDGGDFTLFAGTGGKLDLNGDKKIELGVRTTPVSCFFKKNTVNVQSILPRAELLNSTSDSGPYWGAPQGCSTGTGGIHPPTVSCNGSTWLKWSVLRSACADDMLFDFNPLSTGNYTKFQGWVTGATSGNRIDLSALFVRIFYDTAMIWTWINDGITGFNETTLGDVSYTTVAQYDLNNDGTADLNEAGADMTIFTSCKGSPASGSCAQADFNNDGAVEESDIAFRDLMVRDLFSQPVSVLMGEATSTGSTVASMVYGQSFSFAPYHWFINWFESMFFVGTKYSDRQIVQYCVGHKPFGSCFSADINESCLKQYRDCGTDMSCRGAAESCKVDAGDIAAFDAQAAPLDINKDGIVNLQLP